MMASQALGSTRRRAALLNPPGTKKYFRDYFCSLVSKANYYYHPIDLIYLSGVLDRAGYFLDCVDAIAEELTNDEAWRRVRDFHPDLVVYLTSSPSFEEDTAFLEELKKRIPDAVFVGSGDIYRELRSQTFEAHPFCDAVLTDFSTPDFVSWLTRTEDGVFDNVIYRGQDGRLIEGEERHGHGFYSMPVPRWDLWPLKKYVFPFSENRLWATILTDFGCPFSCTFCPMSTTGYKLRDIDTVIDELRLLRSLDIHEFLIRDQTFGVNRLRTHELLARIKSEFPELKWTCWSRVDLVNEEFLREIKDAGCHTVMFGIESGNEEILKQYKKNTRRPQMIVALSLARRLGFKTVGTFVIGLPGESESSIRETIEFSTRLPLDYASFNIATPRFGTTFRRIMKEKGSLDTTVMSYDSSRGRPVWLQETVGETLPNDTIFALQREGIRRFYLRPTYLARRLITLKTPYQAWAQMQEAVSLLRPEARTR